MTSEQTSPRHEEEPDLPKVITLPDDEYSLKLLAGILENYEREVQSMEDNPDTIPGDLLVTFNQYKEFILGMLLVQGEFVPEEFLRDAEYFPNFCRKAAEEAILTIADLPGINIGTSYKRVAVPIIIPSWKK